MIRNGASPLSSQLAYGLPPTAYCQTDRVPYAQPLVVPQLAHL